MAKNKKRKVDIYVFRDDDADVSTHVIVEDGGVASCYNVDGYYKTDYYGSRITNQTELENLWDELAEGKMYVKDWNGSDDDSPLKENEVDDEMIMDMVCWLYACTEEVEFVRHEMEWNEENFYKVKLLLKLEE